MRKSWRKIGLTLALVGCSMMMACNAEKKPVQANTASSAASPSGASGAGGGAATAPTLHLVGTEWHLEDLGGAGVIDNSQATLAFPEAGRVAGNSSCNRFMGSVTIEGNTLQFGQLAGTRMACLSEAVSNQETKYLKALEGAARWEWQDPYLLIYVNGMDKPLKYTRVK